MKQFIDVLAPSLPTPILRCAGPTVAVTSPCQPVRGWPLVRCNHCSHPSWHHTHWHRSCHQASGDVLLYTLRLLPHFFTCPISVVGCQAYNSSETLLSPPLFDSVMCIILGPIHRRTLCWVASACAHSTVCSCTLCPAQRMYPNQSSHSGLVDKVRLPAVSA